MNCFRAENWSQSYNFKTNVLLEAMIAASFPPILDPNLIFDKYALAHEQESQTSCLANAVLVVKMIEERFAKYAHNH